MIDKSDCKCCMKQDVCGISKDYVETVQRVEAIPGPTLIKDLSDDKKCVGGNSNIVGGIMCRAFIPN